jgi:N utilization substance protein A
VRQVVNELKGEKVDIVEWNDNPRAFIAEALSPARVQDVQIDDDERTAVVIVPDHQLSLAIGKEGQNARLAARLSGYRIDIRSESQALGLDEDAEEEDVEFATIEEGDGAPVTPAASDADADEAPAAEDAAEVVVAVDDDVEVAVVDEPTDTADEQAGDDAAGDVSPEATANDDDADAAEATDEGKPGTEG